ncbi:hypothetical protein LINGRAHAP2_LOCUS5464, partial [Linum grandiflorum]
MSVASSSLHLVEEVAVLLHLMMTLAVEVAEVLLHLMMTLAAEVAEVLL